MAMEDKNKHRPKKLRRKLDLCKFTPESAFVKTSCPNCEKTDCEMGSHAEEGGLRLAGQRASKR